MADMLIIPAGMLHGSDARKAMAAGRAAALAGRPDVAFCCAALVESPGGSSTRRRILSWPELSASREQAIKAGVQRLITPRAPIAGLDMNRSHVMGIVNITPDSFSDGGKHASPPAATGHARKLAKEGAAILDIGGESTRPGAMSITPEEEIRRIRTTLAALAKETVPVSVDTRNDATMRMAIDAGAAMINDVSALMHDGRSLATVADSGLPVVLMHAQGDPRTMQDAPRYRDVLADVYRFLAERIAACERAGIDRSRIIIDPGIGFGKTLAHNLTLLKNLALFHGLGCPLMLGASRKSFIAAIDERAADHSARLPGSLAAALHGARLGVQFLRVHDVAATVQILSVSRAIHDL